MASLVVKNSQVYKPGECLSDYIAYYTSAKKLVPNAVFIGFQELVKDPFMAIHRIEVNTGINLNPSGKILDGTLGLRKNSTKDKSALAEVRSRLQGERLLPSAMRVFDSLNSDNQNVARQSEK